MGKRKNKDFIASDDEDEEFVKSEPESSGEDELAEEKAKSRKRGKATARDEESDEEDNVPAVKKSKKEILKPQTSKKPKLALESPEPGNVVIRSTADGEKFLDLGKKKRATVRTFKGNTLLDIREFYGADGDEKPGKKGISLGIEQWEALKYSTVAIDSLFADLKK